jgi:Ca2+-binding RTX toxin-like protein
VGDKIAITAVRNGDWEILAMNPDGTGEVNLTNNFTEDENSREDWAPEWSPDGTKIVFMAQYDYPCCGDWEVWVMNADGSGQTNLTNHPAGDTGPSWSPDGTEIIFASNRGDGWSAELYVMPTPATLERVPPTVSAEEPRQITTGGGTSPDWWGLVDRAPCTITGTSRNDLLSGTAGADVICGGVGADRIRSGRGADVVYGGRGGDVLVGGRGPDRLFGGFGPDDIDARDDRGHDSVSGGRGIDSCQADKRDRVTGCP